MKPSVPLLAVLLWQAAAPNASTTLFHYARPVLGESTGPACAVLDSAVFAHSAPYLKDLRVRSSAAVNAPEIPFVLTLSEAGGAEPEPARILNLGARGRDLVFDLEMPARPYTDVRLDVAATDFVLSADVTGSDTPGVSSSSTSLGAFTLFDLASQHLARSTTVHLQESRFRFLHIVLHPLEVHGADRLPPQSVRGATVPPSREAQTIYTVAVSANQLVQRGSDTVAHFDLPERVPIERVSFTLAPGFPGNFSRDISVITHVAGSGEDTAADSFNGRIERVRLTRDGREISDTHLTVPATLGANLQSSAGVEVAVHNGDDPSLPIASVQLEMRQRQICMPFLPAGATLVYGDPNLPAPQFDFARTFAPGASVAVAHLGPERVNPRWRPLLDARPYAERHPHLLWIALLAVICSLALVAFRSSKSLPR